MHFATPHASGIARSAGGEHDRIRVLDSRMPTQKTLILGRGKRQGFCTTLAGPCFSRHPISRNARRMQATTACATKDHLADNGVVRRREVTRKWTQDGRD